MPPEYDLRGDGPPEEQSYIEQFLLENDPEFLKRVKAQLKSAFCFTVCKINNLAAKSPGDCSGSSHF